MSIPTVAGLRAPPALGLLAPPEGLTGRGILAVLAATMLPLGPSRSFFHMQPGTIGASLLFALLGPLIVRFLRGCPEPVTFLLRLIAMDRPALLPPTPPAYPRTNADRTRFPGRTSPC